MCLLGVCRGVPCAARSAPTLTPGFPVAASPYRPRTLQRSCGGEAAGGRWCMLRTGRTAVQVVTCMRQEEHALQIVTATCQHSQHQRVSTANVNTAGICSLRWSCCCRLLCCNSVAPYLRPGGGGVTCSGGEALLQPHFTSAIFQV
jgi:hypothetical protein